MRRFVSQKIGNTVYTWEMTLTESIKWASAEFLVTATCFVLAYAFVLVPAPLFFIVAFFYCSPRQRWVVNLIGILVSALILFDYTHGWLMQMIFHELGADSFLSSVVSINLGVLVAHVILLIAGNLLMNDERRTKRFVPSVFLIMTIIPLITFLFGQNFLVPYHNSTEALKEVKKQEHYEIVKAYLLEKHFNQGGLTQPSFRSKEELEKVRMQSPEFLAWEGELFKKAIEDLGYQDDPLFKDEPLRLKDNSSENKSSQVNEAKMTSALLVSSQLKKDSLIESTKHSESPTELSNKGVVVQSKSELRQDNSDITLKHLSEQDLRDKMYVMTTGNWTCIYQISVNESRGSLIWEGVYSIKGRDKSLEKDIGQFELKPIIDELYNTPLI